MIVPDSPVPLEAYRIWGVKGTLLQSATSGFCGGTTVWTPYEAFEASCLALDTCDEAPNPDHGCGVHAYKTLTDALLWAHSVARVRPVVVGRVKLWGKVVEMGAGYRAQFAYPHTLSDPRVAGAYGVACDG